MQPLLDSLSSSIDKLLSNADQWIDEFVLFLPNILLAGFIGLISFFISKNVRKIAVRSISKITKNKTVLGFSANLVSVIFSVIVLFIMLSVLNLDDAINKILATAGVLGLAVGLALQDPINNLFSGVFMSVRELYRIGDLVETNGYFGYITKIDLRATKIKLPGGEEVTIPNKKVIQNPLKNYDSSGMRRVDIPVGVHYDDDLSKVEETAIKAIKQVELIDRKKPVDVLYSSFGDSSVNLDIRFWLDDPSLKTYLTARSLAIKQIKTAFDHAGITIPFPIRTLKFAGHQNLTITQKNSRAIHVDSN